MQTKTSDQDAVEVLQSRIRLLLPEQYQDRSEEVKPVSMGSAGLKFASDGRVAWDEMWGSFCDLAMAGGPPHKGTLLEPASRAAIASDPERYSAVVEEICRGIEMVADLPAEPSSLPGWIKVDCVNYATARWLLRAITMENVSARSEGTVLSLPAGPHYRIEKEIKNVVTAIAKTSHYWFGHTSQTQRRDIGKLFVEMEQESPLLQPAVASDDSDHESSHDARSNVAKTVTLVTGLRESDHAYAGWLGIGYPNVRAAIWMMRALVASNVLSRRESTAFFVPLDRFRDPQGTNIVQLVKRLHGFAQALQVL